MTIRYVDAIDEETLDYDYLHPLGEDLREKDGHRDLSIGEIALSMSHQKIYRHILDADIDVALIAEDDQGCSRTSVSPSEVTVGERGTDGLTIGRLHL